MRERPESHTLFERISTVQFLDLTQWFIRKPISRAWKGVATAIFFEFGDLKSHYERTGNPKGEAGLMIEWSWRVERPRSIYFGSEDKIIKIKKRLAKLEGLTIVNITTETRIPEIVIALSNNLCIRSIALTEGQPKWALFLPDGSWIHTRLGHLEHEMNNPAPISHN